MFACSTKETKEDTLRGRAGFTCNTCGRLGRRFSKEDRETRSASAPLWNHALCKSGVPLAVVQEPLWVETKP